MRAETRSPHSSDEVPRKSRRRGRTRETRETAAADTVTPLMMTWGEGGGGLTCCALCQDREKLKRGWHGNGT